MCCISCSWDWEGGQHQHSIPNSTFPYTARLRVRLAMSGPWPVQVRLCPAERTVCTMASLPFPFSIPAHDTVSEWSWIFRRKSSDRQIGDRNERVAGTITSARTVARWSYPDTVGRVRTLVHAVQAPHDGDVLRTPTIHRVAAAGPYMYPLVPTANSAHSVALSPAFSSA